MGHHRGCGTAPQNGGGSLRAESGAGVLRGPSAFWGPPALAKRPERGGPASPQALPEGKGRGAVQRLTQGRRSQAPLTARRCPSAPATPAEQLPSPGAPQPHRRVRRGRRCRRPPRSVPGVLGAGLVGQAPSSFGGREKGMSPFTRRNSAPPGTPLRGVGAPVCLNSGTHEGKTSVPEGFGRKAMRMLHLPGAARRRAVAGQG